jgi:hypothetical protein
MTLNTEKPCKNYYCCVCLQLNRLMIFLQLLYARKMLNHLNPGNSCTLSTPFSCFNAMLIIALAVLFYRSTRMGIQCLKRKQHFTTFALRFKCSYLSNNSLEVRVSCFQSRPRCKRKFNEKYVSAVQTGAALCCARQVMQHATPPRRPSCRPQRRTTNSG